ncbi:hypothetical protein MRB53_015433 [Persea americana]|uniref:Uncharacterized protein n=1 Tax=Persea americana TaxID=3435 RepID=A0ACC2KE42_PERAE|nr:hypothetical protein MRB53_015433 [Persea americana]
MAKAHVLLGLLLIGFSLSVVDARKKVGIYEIQRGNFSLKLTNWGATVISVILPDSQGNLNDVVLGFDTIPSYVNDTTYFGATVGRVANRIDGAQFWMNGHHYRTFPNEGNNTLHGGNRGFSKVIWTVVEHDTGEFPYIKFYYHSFDGEQGFPGDLDVFVTYKIVDDYSLSITMTAEALNKPTPVNLAHHTYWNLAGHDSGNILSNTVQLFASHYTPVDDVTLIPTGELLTVEGTPYDFREPHVIGSRINQTAFGYDFNYALDKHGDENNLRKAAVVKDHKTGRQLELWTNQVGLQFYSGNQLNNVVGKGGHVYKIYGGLCLESQGFPDSVNKVYFPSQARRPGQDYTNHMLYEFSF